jgi:flavin-dependent dehydrogenase
MMSQQHNFYDLIVVGGGSAGMAAAIHAAQSGKRVKVFDAAGPDFDKPCGEGLMPPAIQALRQLGVRMPDASPLSGVRYFVDSGRSAYAPFSKSQAAMGIRRRLLRQAMWQRASELGVVIVQETADQVSVSPESVVVNHDTADYLCIASGAHSRLLKDLGLRSSRRKRPTGQRSGLRRHVNVKPWSDCVEVYWRDHCELYVTPVSESCVNIAILSWNPFQFDNMLKLFPEVLAKIEGATWGDEASGRAPLLHRASRVQSGRIFVAGDAALFLDAMTGEGNTLAIRSGMAVARAIMDGRPSIYRWYWLQVVWRYWLLTTPVLLASRQLWMRNRLLNLVVGFPWLLRIGVAFLSTTSKR